MMEGEYGGVIANLAAFYFYFYFTVLRYKFLN